MIVLFIGIWAVFIFALTIGLNVAFPELFPSKTKDGETTKVISPASESAKKAGKAIILGSIAFLVAALFWHDQVYMSDDAVAARNSEQANKRCNDSVHAYVMSQNFVKRKLISPSSAKFPNITSIRSESIGDCRFRVVAWVDADNSFAASIRLHYVAEMDYVPKTDRWRAVSLEIDSK